MQQTTADRWLRKKLIYINRIYCNTLPRKVPYGVKVEEAPEESGGRFHYKLSTRSEQLTADVAEALASENITYTCRVEDRKVWYARYLNDPNKSLTYRIAWVMIGICFGLLIKSGLPMDLIAYLADEEKPGVEETVTEAVSGAMDKVDNDTKVFEMQDRLMEIDRLEE